MRVHMMRLARLAAVLLFAVPADLPSKDSPRSVDDRLVVELVAEHPEIVTPTGLAVDDRGRVFVAESHTHFRPDDYDGPPADRILIFEDTNGDGRGDKRTIFHEGFQYVMDIEFESDGSLIVATRKDIHRLRDINQDDRADEIERLVSLETSGNYPHNGLSGIAFDFRGGFHFGLGENLGEPYTLIGSDGARITGGGEGGSTYHVAGDGSKLRRVSTGWWNPYGMCTDSFGRVFGTDNDPDSSPPCRLIQVIEQGDYGYEFRYGRSGRNPLITWDGETPGTLPMVAGTGEAPCHIVSYESDAFPNEYFGNLLVPSWADHRVERYALQQPPDRGLVETRRQPWVEGPDDFRPVGIDVAPDGSVYISDWVSSSYPLHKQGRVWRIRPREFPARSADPGGTRRLARDRRLREERARELSSSSAGREQLLEWARGDGLPQARATALVALSNSDPDPAASLCQSLLRDTQSPPELRILAAQLGPFGDTWQSETLPAPVRAALLEQVPSVATERLEPLLIATDPRLRQAAIGALSRSLARGPARVDAVKDSARQLSWLLAWKRARITSPRLTEDVPRSFLQLRDPDVRFAAVKWIADEKLVSLRPQLEQLFEASDLDLRTFLATSAALERLDGKKVSDRPPPERLKDRIEDQRTSAALRRLCLRLVDPASARISLDTLQRLVADPDESIQVEAVRAVARHTDERRLAILREIAGTSAHSLTLRAEAVLGLAARADRFVDELIKYSFDPQPAIQDEALRALVGVQLNETQRMKLAQRADSEPRLQEAIIRILNPSAMTRPPTADVAAWSKFVADAGNAAVGERIFLGVKVGRCAACHVVEGLGESVGPDLSQMSRRLLAAGKDGRQWLLETILHPSRDMAPQFTPWQIVTTDGKQYLGLPRRKGGDSEAYLGIDGKEFSLKVAEIESRHEATVSIMPADLLQQLTRQELADLFAFVGAAR